MYLEIFKQNKPTIPVFNQHMTTGRLPLPEVESRTQGSRPRPRTQKNSLARAMDKPSRSWGPWTQAQVFSKKRSSKNFYMQKGLQKPDRDRNWRVLSEKLIVKAKWNRLYWKSYSKFFSGDLYLRKTKIGFRKFSAKFLAFFNKISTVQKIVLSSSRVQGNFRGLEPLRPRPRASNCVLEDVLEAKAKNFKMYPRGQGCPPGLHLWPAT